MSFLEDFRFVHFEIVYGTFWGVFGPKWTKTFFNFEINTLKIDQIIFKSGRRP